MKVKISNLLKRGDKIATGFSFESDWLRRWREFSRSITALSRAKVKRSRLLWTLDFGLVLRVFGSFVNQRCGCFGLGLHETAEVLRREANLPDPKPESNLLYTPTNRKVCVACCRC